MGGVIFGVNLHLDVVMQLNHIGEALPSKGRDKGDRCSLGQGEGVAFGGGGTVHCQRRVGVNGANGDGVWPLRQRKWRI